jgi:drug/metabolite transporter (DMT)-like permease
MRNLKMLAPVGAFEAIAVLTQMMTQGLSLAAFAISLKRTSIIFSAILGQKYFGEKINDRIIPILIIVLGIILIAID